MTLIAFVYMRNQIRPIKLLARAAERFGRGESVPYRLRGANEVRAAGAAFLSMRARLERQIEQRTLMLSGVSHDLRTPLTRLRLGLSTLDVDESEASEIAAMESDVAEMEKLIDAFLSFARSDTLEEPKVVDVPAVLERLCEQAKRAGGNVSLSIQKGVDTTLVMRELAFERAINNLISNALRYGDEANISLKQYDRAIVIYIEDNGPGIAKEDRERAVQPFVRLDSARNQDLGSGVGLGLSITTDIIRRHGGSLRLSKSPNLGGLMAEVVLPLDKEE